MRTCISILLISLLAAVPADALADKRFRGKSQQGRTVIVLTGDDNTPKDMRINWLTRRCSLTGTRFQNKVRFMPPFDAAAPGSFRDADTYPLRQRGGIRIRVRISTSGQLVSDASGERWTGWIRAKAVIRRKGRVIDRCTLRKTYWTATPA
jgi:hypothetical protein